MDEPKVKNANTVKAGKASAAAKKAKQDALISNFDRLKENNFRVLRTAYCFTFIYSTTCSAPNFCVISYVSCCSWYLFL